MQIWPHSRMDLKKEIRIRGCIVLTRPLDLVSLDAEKNGFLYSSKKFLMICAPTAPLFSGWNWVPKKLSRPSAPLKELM